jgi:hypothetical protein
MKSSNSVYTGFEFEADGFPALAIINKDLKEFAEKSAYRDSVFIEIIPDRFNELGQPEVEEYDYLNDIEKDIIEYLESQTKTVHVGHTTLFRKREIIFYTAEAEKVQSFLEHFLPTVERENYFEIEEDTRWENVSAFYDLL